MHEEAHAVQKHSLDVLFIEVLQIIFWFNPLIYLTKHSIKLNHEFLADDAVLNHGVSTSDYGKILLDYSQPNFKNKSLPMSIGMASSINYSSIKKRFTVMKKNTSKKSVWLRSLFFLPLVAALIYGFSNKETVEVVVQSNQNKLTEQVVPQNAEEGATEKMMQEYNDYIQKYQSVKKRILKISEYNRIKDIYDLMTAEQKTSVVDHNTLFRAVNFDFSAPKRKMPSQTEFNSWKNSKKFAIWIDSKHVPNSELDNYSVDDIVYYSGSFVYKNARSKNFPQEYQFHLSTKQGFENTYLKSGFNKYEALRKTYNSQRKAFLNSGSKDNSELRLLHARLWKMYKKFTPKEIEKYDITTPKPYPYYKTKAEQKSEDNLKNIKVYEDKKPSSSRIKTNNKVVENYPLEFYIRKMDDAIIVSMRKKQMVEAVKKDKFKSYLQDLIKETALKPEKFVVIINIEKNTEKSKISFVEKTLRSLNILKINKKDYTPPKSNPNFPPPPPPPVKATAKQVAEYNAWAKSINAQMAKAKVNNDINEYPIVKIKLVNKYKAIYKIMSEAQKKASEPWPSFPPPPPPAPKVKKGEKSNIPPPPPPPAKATPKQLAEYNTLAKKYNAQPINERVVKLKDLKKLEYVYGKMSLKQKENAQPFPECPPPPPSPVVQKGEKSHIPPPSNKPKNIAKNGDKTGWVQINNEKHYYITDENGNTKYFNRWGVQVDKDGKSLKKGEKSNVPPPPPPAMDTIFTYNSIAKRTKFIPNNRKKNIQHLKVLFNKMSDSQKEKVENPNSISKYIGQLNNLTSIQIKKINEVYNKIKARAQSKGRKFYTAAEYKELEELYAGMLNN